MSTHDQRCKVLLSLFKDRFDELRSTIISDYKLQGNFTILTHQHYGKEFFPDKYAAISYLKEDVFCSEERTKRVFTLLIDNLKGNFNYWNAEGSDTDLEAEPQEFSNDEENSPELKQKRFNPPKIEAKVQSIDFNAKINEIEYECEIKIKQLKSEHEKKFNELRQ